MLKGHKSLQCAGPWPMPTELTCFTPCSTLKEKRRSLDLAAKRQALRLLQAQRHAPWPLKPQCRALWLLKPPRQALQRNERTSVCRCQPPLHTRTGIGSGSQLVQEGVKKLLPRGSGRKKHTAPAARRWMTLKQDHHEDRRRKRKNSPLPPEEDLGGRPPLLPRRERKN